MSRPLLVVVSAPSGAGKTTLCDRLLREFPDFRYSISCTTRAPRGREVHGKEYYFLTEREFAEHADHGDFLEHATVHGFRYGTLRSEVEGPLSRGGVVVLDIDVQGAGQIRDYAKSDRASPLLRDAFVDVFIEPPSMEILEQRLFRRAEDGDDVIRRRVAVATKEMEQRHLYRYRIVNDDLETAYSGLRGIILNERMHSRAPGMDRD